MKTVQNIRLAHFESYSSFSYCTRVFLVWCSDPVVECLNKINILQSTTGPLGQNTRVQSTVNNKGAHDSVCTLFFANPEDRFSRVDAHMVSYMSLV